MEMGELQGSKRSRVDANGWGYGDGDAKSGEGKGGGGVGVGVGIHANWHQNSSRICRVSRASGGKDRHSKVLTAKGLRDRRVRLSVSTAIQFYDLQDRLGVDQPSKAVEWLIKAASAAISELPALDGSFLDPPDLMSEGNPRRDARGEVDASNDNKHEYEPQQQQQHLSRSKSACSSTSETSKGSVLSLSRSDIRVKARERAKERAAKDKEKKEGESAHHNQNQQQNHNSQSTFTELLTGGGSTQAQGLVTLAEAHPGSNGNGNGDAIFFHKQMRHLPTAITTDYFSQAGLFGQGQKHHQQPGFPGQSQYGNSSSGIMSFNTVVASSAGDHSEMQQPYSFLQDHLIPVTAVAPGGEYSLNFSISSGLAGFNRGTLQSNPPSSISHHHHLQRLSSSVDGISLPFGISAPTAATPTSGENPFPSEFDSRLQLYYRDGYRSSDLKGKGKN